MPHVRVKQCVWGMRSPCCVPVLQLRPRGVVTVVLQCAGRCFQDVPTVPACCACARRACRYCVDADVRDTRRLTTQRGVHTQGGCTPTRVRTPCSGCRTVQRAHGRPSCAFVFIAGCMRSDYNHVRHDVAHRPRMGSAAYVRHVRARMHIRYRCRSRRTCASSSRTFFKEPMTAGNVPVRCAAPLYERSLHCRRSRVPDTTVVL